MKKNVTKTLLVAAVVLGLCWSVASCKDDDNDNNASEQFADADALDTDEARTAWRWLCALTDATALDDKWKTKTWEPTVGRASESSPFVRLEVVSNLREAKEKFSILANKDPEEVGTMLVVNGGAAGTMTWRASAAGAQNLAVVEVKSSIMPHLQQIIYCTHEQLGSNSSMKGVAYYRFGDVIRDDDGYYWVCVRPAFAPDKEKSHWINIVNATLEANKRKDADEDNLLVLPAANIKDKWNRLPKYNNQTIILPTQLGYDRQHMHNLSNLIWALLDVPAYVAACAANNNKGLGGFDAKYHGEKFVSTVAAHWYKSDYINQKNIWQILFNRTYEEMKKMKELRFYYQGYSWKWGDSGYLWRYSSRGYKPTYSGSESDDEVTINYVSDGFDVHRYTSYEGAAKVNHQQFDEENGIGTWVVRYKTGSQLRTAGKYTPYISLTGLFNDYYVYNNTEKNVKVGENEVQETEETFKETSPIENVEDIQRGNILGSNGLFYDDLASTYGAGVKPVGIVVLLAYSAGTGRTTTIETGKNWNGFVMALEDIDNVAWGASNNKGSFNCTQLVGDPDIFDDYMDGIRWTEKLGTHGCPIGHSHPAFESCRQYVPNGLTQDMCFDAGLSGWFIPSAGQWLMILRTIGLEWDRNMSVFSEPIEGNNYRALRSFFVNYDLADKVPRGKYWTSTEIDENRNAYYIKLEEDKPVVFSTLDDNDTSESSQHKVRPFIAF